MIRFLALFLLALALGASLAYYLRAENGYVMIHYGPWIIETSVLGFIGAGLVMFFALYYAARWLLAGLRLPATLKDFMAARRERRAQQSFELGLQKLLEGQWQRAEVELVRRAADHHAPELNYLLAARAAQLGGAAERRDHYLELAARQNEESTVAAQIVRAELQLQREDYASARAVLEDLHRQEPKNPYVIELLAGCYSRSGEWAALRQLLSSAENQRALPPERALRLQARALRELLARAAEEARRDTLKSLWDGASAALRSEGKVRLAYVQGLARLGADAEAAAQITQALQREWDSALAKEYGELTGIDAISQLASVEQWLRQHGEKPELLLSAGKVCMRNQLWGKARSYLDASLRLQAAPETYHALARLAAETKNMEEANRFYRMGLELAAKPQVS
jgi:HemY protein